MLLYLFSSYHHQIVIFTMFYHLLQWLALVFFYLPIGQCTGGYIFTPDWTWHLKSPFPVFKHWSNVGQPEFRPLVLSTSPLRLCIRQRVHPCARVDCFSVLLYVVWEMSNLKSHWVFPEYASRDHWRCSEALEARVPFFYWSDNAYQDQTDNILTCAGFWVFTWYLSKPRKWNQCQQCKKILWKSRIKATICRIWKCLQ